MCSTRECCRAGVILLAALCCGCAARPTAGQRILNETRPPADQTLLAPPLSSAEPAEPLSTQSAAEPEQAFPSTSTAPLAREGGALVQRAWPRQAVLFPNGGTVGGPYYLTNPNPSANQSPWITAVTAPLRWAVEVALLPVNLLRAPPWKRVVYQGDAIASEGVPEAIQPQPVDPAAQATPVP